MRQIKRLSQICCFFVISLSIVGCLGRRTSREINFQQLIQPVPKNSILEDEHYFTWGASMVEGDDGKYHLFYSRWLKEKGFNAWVTDSEIAHAISDTPAGPYVFKEVSLPARGAQYWDGLCTHNPTVHKFGNKYFLYYMGNTGDGKNTKTLNFSHRNNQRIGVAVKDSINGLWKRLDHPLIDVSPNPEAPDALAVNNPSVAKTPDGRYLMMYKAIAKNKPLPFGGPVSHMVAFSDSPMGPFVKEDKTVLDIKDNDFPAEDPFIWVQDKKYWAILKDMNGAYTGQGRSLVLFNSENGIDWKLAKHPLVSKLQIEWEGGTIKEVSHLERPQLWLKNGVPTILFLAADNDLNHSFNIHIPLKKN